MYCTFRWSLFYVSGGSNHLCSTLLLSFEFPYLGCSRDPQFLSVLEFGSLEAIVGHQQFLGNRVFVGNVFDVFIPFRDMNGIIVLFVVSFLAVILSAGFRN